MAAAWFLQFQVQPNTTGAEATANPGGSSTERHGPRTPGSVSGDRALSLSAGRQGVHPVHGSRPSGRYDVKSSGYPISHASQAPRDHLRVHHRRAAPFRQVERCRGRTLPNRNRRGLHGPGPNRIGNSPTQRPGFHRRPYGHHRPDTCRTKRQRSHPPRGRFPTNVPAVDPRDLTTPRLQFTPRPGTPRVKASVRLLTRRFVWHNIKRDVSKWARQCLACQRAKIHRHTKPRLEKLPVPEGRFRHVHVDLVGHSHPRTATRTSSPQWTVSPGGRRHSLSAQSTRRPWRRLSPWVGCEVRGPGRHHLRQGTSIRLVPLGGDGKEHSEQTSTTPPHTTPNQTGW